MADVAASTQPKEFPTALPLQERSIQIPKEDSRLVKGDDGHYRLTFPCASETPVPRWYGDEVLSHKSDAIRMDRMKRGAVMYLFNHDEDDPVGVIEDGRLQASRLFVDVKFFKTTRAEEVAVMIDGGFRNVSLKYRIHVVEEDVKKQRYTITDWEPYEVSSVSIPADASVGVGRAQERGEQFAVRKVSEISAKPAAVATVPSTTTAQADNRGVSMSDQDNNAAAGAIADRSTDSAAAAATRIEAGKQEVDKNFAAEAEKRRVSAIRNLGKVNGIGDDTVQNWISKGFALDAVADDILAIHDQRGKTAPRSISALGISEREAGQYSMCRAILAARDGNWRNAGFELECHKTIADKSDKPQTNHTFYVPLEVQRRQSSISGQHLAGVLERHQLSPLAARDLTAGMAGAGGFLVGTSIMGFDELLRNISFALRMGATRLTGLRDNVTIPRQSAAATAEWLTGESGAATESQPSFVQLAMTPKTVSAYTELSRKLLLQSSIDVEGLVNADLAAVAALAVDVAVLSGSGASGQPLGLDNVTGVGTVSGSSLGLAGILETQTDLAAANVMPMRGGYVTNPAVAALMIAEVAYANTASPLWVGNVWGGQMMGFPAMSTNQVASGRMYFGAWENCVIGEWGVLEIDTNPYASFGAGLIGVRAMYSVDVGIRRPFAFTIASSIT